MGALLPPWKACPPPPAVNGTTVQQLLPTVTKDSGLLLMAGGVFGFLPVLGFWMIPLGIAVAALDVVPAWRRIRGRRKPEKIPKRK